DDNDRTVIHATLSQEAERFSVGDTYEVYVYRTRDTSLAWLDLPLADGELARFPMHLPATHLQFVRGGVALEAGEIVATGQPGAVLSGPNLELPRGTYTATWIGQGIDSSGQLTFAVTSRRRRILAQVAVDARQLPTARGELARLAFTIDRPLNRIEL